MVPISYGALFAMILATGAGLPVPEDLVVAGGGVAVAKGYLALVPTMAVAFAAVLAGDLVLYAVGRGALRPLARRFRADRMARAEAAFARWGDLAIVVARFIPGVRAVVFFAAGTLRRPLRRFLLLDGLACLVQVPLLVLAGRHALSHHLVLAGAAALALGVLLWKRARLA